MDNVEKAKRDKTDHSKKQIEKNKLKTKQIPSIVMLTAGAVASVVTYWKGYALKDALLSIFTTLIVFLFVGAVVKFLLDRIELPVTKEIGGDGEVIEKTSEDGSGDTVSEGPEEEEE